MLKTAPGPPVPAAYDAFTAGLDLLVAAPPELVEAAAVRALWVLVAELGFGPALSACVRDGTPIEAVNGSPVAFSAAEGGVLCPSCTPAQPPTRLPAEDYRDLVALNDPRVALPALDAPHAAAHRRLVARFVRYHLGVESLTAVDSWERHAWAS
jgi:recombinational DNA repair protein (RecF pathway)